MEKLESKVEQDKGFDLNALDRTFKGLGNGILKTTFGFYALPTFFRCYEKETDDKEPIPAPANFAIGGLVGFIGGILSSALTIPTYFALKSAGLFSQETINYVERLGNQGPSSNIMMTTIGVCLFTNLASAVYESIRTSYLRNKTSSQLSQRTQSS